ncbi:MAG: YcfL family protein [Sedimentisphaerales bacterium]|nr:YcfL family protein [Sedimentisphaerales bacterium]
MKTFITTTLFVLVLTVAGCFEPKHDSRIKLREEVGSSSLGDNIVTRTVGGAFSWLIGEGIDVKQAVTRRNEAGLMELHVNGYNRSYDTKRFKYRVEWLDADGMLIQSKTSVWLPMSAMGKSPFGIKAVAPTPEAVNFRMDTKKWE